MTPLHTLVSAIRAQDAAAARECPVPEWLVYHPQGNYPRGWWYDASTDREYEVSDDAARLVVGCALRKRADAAWAETQRRIRVDVEGRYSVEDASGLAAFISLFGKDHEAAAAFACGYTLPTEAQP